MCTKTLLQLPKGFIGVASGVSLTLREVSLFGVFLVRILGTRKTPNVDTFHAVRLLLKYMFFPDISLEKINLFPNF